jgi:hypothetical protein
MTAGRVWEGLGDKADRLIVKELTYESSDPDHQFADRDAQSFRRRDILQLRRWNCSATRARHNARQAGAALSFCAVIDRHAAGK